VSATMRMPEDVAGRLTAEAGSTVLLGSGEGRGQLVGSHLSRSVSAALANLPALPYLLILAHDVPDLGRDARSKKRSSS